VAQLTTQLSALLRLCCVLLLLLLQLLEKLRAEADEAERRRLWRKERSETIRYTPRRSQDPILFHAMNRQWDEKMSQEELRGAKAAARKVGVCVCVCRGGGLKSMVRVTRQQSSLRCIV
jgi:hypothetical protein